MAVYFVARNGRGRPMLMHAADLPLTSTRCGLDATYWSRKYFTEPIEVILCLKCKKAVTK